MRNFSELAKAWPSPIVARSEVGKFSGNVLHPRTMANIDSNPNIEGPERITLGRKVAYFKDSLVAWMNERANVEAEKRQSLKGSTQRNQILDEKKEAGQLNSLG